MNSLVVVESGPLTTVQDRGRTGWAHLGVPRGGALDLPAAALANRLVGNDRDAAVLEVTAGGLVVRVQRGCWVAITGAEGPAHVDQRPVGRHQATWVPPRAVLHVGTATRGVRAYVAFAGGIAVPPVLGSRSTDTLAGVGPPIVAVGTELPLGRPSGPPPFAAAPVVRRRPASLRLWPGPRIDWLATGEWDRLLALTWTVSPSSNRVGLRLGGAALRRRDGEIASEGMVLGAVQLPPNGEPVVFLADHPVTGGYPVVAVVEPADLWVAAQSAPGDTLRFSPVRGSAAPER